MPREISDEEYQFLQGKRQIADFVETIYQNPKFANKAKALIKEAYPNINIPDFDIRTEVTQRLDAEAQARRDAEEATKVAKEDEEWRRVRKQTQESYGFTDEAMQRLERIMVEKKIGDYEVAATYLTSREPKAIEPGFDQGHWHHERQDGFKEIIKDPESWARNELIQAMHRDEQKSKQRY
jgi:hypothetical protein